jgi:hypothetical protein
VGNVPGTSDSRPQQLRQLLALLRNEFVARAARASDPRDAVRWAADPAHDRRPRLHLRPRDLAAAERAAQGRNASVANVVRGEWPTARWLAWMRLPAVFRVRTRALGYLNPGRWLAFLLSGDAEDRDRLDQAVDDRTHEELRGALEVDRGRGRTSKTAASARRAREEVSLDEMPNGCSSDDVPLDEATAHKLDTAAEFDRVLAVATETQQRQLRAVHAVLIEHPDLSWSEAWTAAGLTKNQRKNLTKRLRRRLA